MGTTIEVIFAFAGIMLGLSLAITILNQLASNIFGLRGSTLKWGLVTMLDELHPQAMRPESKLAGKDVVARSHSDSIVEFVLIHPLISDSSTPRFSFLHQWRRATALEFEDLQRILSHTSNASVSDERLEVSNAATWTDEEARTWLSRNMAVTKEWFNAMMARVSQRFSMKMRVLTAFFAFILAFFLHINTFDLLARLQANPSQVAAINAKLETRISELDPTKQSAAELEAKGAVVKDLRKEFEAAGIAIYPRDWASRFPARVFSLQLLPVPTVYKDPKPFLGLLLTAILLSLGAPFWFNQLKNISTLRSLVAKKADTSAPSGQSPMAVLAVTERNLMSPKV